jgi:hypothetical protein
MKQKILVIADEHFGSPYGLMPPNFCDCDGKAIAQSKEQAYMWANFTALIDAASKKFPSLDMVVQNGDIIDGNPNKAGDKETCLHRSEDQVNLAILGLKNLSTKWPKASWFFVQGTKNHEKPAEVRQIASAFSGAYHQTFRFNVGELGVQINHEVSGASFTALERQMSYADRNTSRFGYSRVHVAIRAHVHAGGQGLFLPGGAILTVPALQRPTVFMRSKEPDRACPVMGFTVLELDDSELSLGGHGVIAHQYTWVLDEKVYRAA